ncbi:SusC/RagA family TonB-linked outer membrane protein [Sphingobacterium suaedae]|uniref:SusC/RagA family TonB-linked outer membrane protein n=1 Tax=Sphingobacterium suaedae TaxID=1686402 RepID=A0ABW5KLU3_9SPHI
MNRLYIAFTILFSVVVHVLFAQENISGVVRDKNGPVPSVTVFLASSNKPITATDANGAFQVSVPPKSVLLFKGIGYDDYRLTIQTGKQTYNIRLTESDQMLEEAVVVGYQARKKESLTGSAVVISGKDIQDVPAASFTDLLQGKVAGLNIQLNNGTPGMRGSMAIRGVSNVNVTGSGDNAFLTPTSPLFVIDGVPIDENTGYEYGFQSSAPGISPISLIPPEDIQDIVVLKDAQATALYGSRGAYGVILVTTKRGNSTVPIVQYTSQMFYNTVPRLRDVVGGVSERRLRIMQILQYDSTYVAAMKRINDTPFLSDSLNAYYNNSTDWQGLFYRNTVNHSQNINVSGGNQSFNYKLNGGFYQEKGIIQNTGFNRYTLQMNMQYRPSQKFMLSAYINSSLGKNSTGSGNAFNQSGVGQAANTSSLLPAPSFSSASNAALAALTVDDDNKTANLVNQVELQYQPITGLTATTTLNYTYNFATKDRFLPGALNANSSEIFSYNDRRNKLYNRTMLSFTKTFAEKHTILAYGFTEVEFNNFRAESMRLRGTPNDQITAGLGYNTRDTRGGTLDNIAQSRLLSYSGAFNYNFDSRYIGEFTYRIDGSSATGNINPWSYNPSVGLRWNFKEESFMQDIDWLTYGWLRGSWGKNISPGAGIYDVYGRYTSGGSYNNRPGTELDLKTVPNISLLPVKTTQWSGAIELGFFDSQLTMIYENYYKQTDQQLRTKKIANHNAFGEVMTNETAMVNMGHEMILNYRPKFQNKDWDFSFSANGAINKDYVTALPDGVRQFIEEDPNVTNLATLFRLGLNSRTNVLLHYRGVYKTDDDVPVNPVTGLRYRSGKAITDEAFFRAGDPIWTDINGDYILDENDFVFVGNSLPIFTGGVNSFIRYKEWSLNTQFVLNIKRDIMNNALADRFRNYADPDNAKGNADGKNPGALVPLDEYDVWRMVGDDAYYPNPFDFTRIRGAFNPYRYDQTLFMEDGTYVKFQTATLAYNFDRDRFIKRLGISSLRVYLTANNIITFSRYSGPDPELVTSMGRDSSNGYPNRRSYTVGLNVQF